MGTSAPDPFVLGGGFPGDPDLRLCYLGYGSRGRAGKARVGCWIKVKTCVFPIIISYTSSKTKRYKLLDCLFPLPACLGCRWWKQPPSTHSDWKKRGPQEMTHHSTRFGGPKIIDPNLFEPPPKKNHGKNPGAGYHGHGSSSQSKFGHSFVELTAGFGIVLVGFWCNVSKTW